MTVVRWTGAEKVDFEIFGVQVCVLHVGHMRASKIQALFMLKVFAS